jgi:hypothetical protein
MRSDDGTGRHIVIQGLTEQRAQHALFEVASIDWLQA